MSKMWLIAITAYRTRVRSGTFLFLTFFLPVLMVLAGILMPILMATSGEDIQKMGIVDQTHQLFDIPPVVTEDISLVLMYYEDIEQAQNAYLAGDVDAYLVIPPGYFAGETAIYYGEHPPGSTLTTTLERLMRSRLLHDMPESVLDLYEQPAEVIYVEFSTGTEISSGFGLAARIITPLLMAFLFGMAVAFTSVQLGSAVVREKEQRAMEIVITSLKPIQLVAGNVLGMSLLVLTQLSIWFLGGVIAFLFFTSGEIDLGTIIIPWNTVLWGLSLMLPGFLLYGVLASGAGVIAGDTKQAQQLASFVGLLAYAPLWFAYFLISQPDGVLAIALTIFPLTAPTVAMVRMAFAEVATWQLAASFASVVLSFLLAVWIVAKVFRAAMLVYGQPLSPVKLWLAIRQS
jgi:ABC-2 type transport system permease protein